MFLRDTLLCVTTSADYLVVCCSDYFMSLGYQIRNGLIAKQYTETEV
jgi:hypothetical protein